MARVAVMAALIIYIADVRRIYKLDLKIIWKRPEFFAPFPTQGHL